MGSGSPRRPVGLLLGLLLGILLGLLAACGPAGDADGARGESAGPDTAAAAGPDTAAAAGLAEPGPPNPAFHVWFTRDEEPVAVARPTPGPAGDAGPAGRAGDAGDAGDATATAVARALRALVAGPIAAEREAGLFSWFSDSTRHVLRGVSLDDGFLVVDFRDLPALIPNASSSGGSRMLLLTLDSTALQFPAVDSIEYRLDGSCDAFWEWLQRGCERVRR